MLILTFAVAACAGHHADLPVNAPDAHQNLWEDPYTFTHHERVWHRAVYHSYLRDQVKTLMVSNIL
jgi:hypothetical protein